MTLKERREAVGFLQETVAKIMGVTQAVVSRWKSGDTKRISRKNHKKLAKLYGCTGDELLKDNEKKEDAYVLFHWRWTDI